MSSEFDFQPDENIDKHSFTIVYNELIESNISPGAFRLITFMCSQRRGWKFHDYKLREVCQCGESKFKELIRELKELGYMQTLSIPSGLGDGKFKGSKRIFSNRPIFKNTERLDFNRSVTANPSTESMICRQSVLPTVGETTSEVNNTKSINNTKSNNNTHARAPATLNPKEVEQAKAAVAAFVEGEEKKGHGEFVYTPSIEPLIVDLGKLDVSNDRAQRLINRHGEPRVREAMEYAQAKAKTNPGGYLEKALAGEWGKGWKEKKEAPKEEDEAAARRHQEAVEQQKSRAEWEAREKGRLAALENPGRVNDLVAESKKALKRAMMEARVNSRKVS